MNKIAFMCTAFTKQLFEDVKLINWIAVFLISCVFIVYINILHSQRIVGYFNNENIRADIK